MTDAPDPLSALVAIVDREIARLKAAAAVDVRDELQFSLWPFLRELVTQLAAELRILDEGETDEDLTNLVVRTIGMIGNLLGPATANLTPDETEALTTAAAGIVSELAALVGADDLAALLHRQAAPATPATPAADAAPTEAAP